MENNKIARSLQSATFILYFSQGCVTTSYIMTEVGIKYALVWLQYVIRNVSDETADDNAAVLSHNTRNILRQKQFTNNRSKEVYNCDMQNNNIGNEAADDNAIVSYNHMNRSTLPT